jgi:hypothetical protein
MQVTPIGGYLKPHLIYGFPSILFIGLSLSHATTVDFIWELEPELSNSRGIRVCMVVGGISPVGIQ